MDGLFLANQNISGGDAGWIWGLIYYSSSRETALIYIPTGAYHFSCHLQSQIY